MATDFLFYVLCEESLRSGIKHGCWIDATSALKDIQAEIDKMLKTSAFDNATQWRIQQYETAYCFDFLDDAVSLETLHQMGTFMEAHGDKGAKLLEYLQGDVREAEAALHREVGCFPDRKAFLQQWLDLNNIPQAVQESVDFAVLWQKVRPGQFFDIKTEDGGIRVFRC